MNRTRQPNTTLLVAAGLVVSGGCVRQMAVPATLQGKATHFFFKRDNITTRSPARIGDYRATTHRLFENETQTVTQIGSVEVTQDSGYAYDFSVSHEGVTWKARCARQADRAGCRIEGPDRRTCRWKFPVDDQPDRWSGCGATLTYDDPYVMNESTGETLAAVGSYQLWIANEAPEETRLAIIVMAYGVHGRGASWQED